MVKSLFGEIFNPTGYIQNNDGIFLFFNIPFTSLIVRNIVYGNKEAYIWTIIDEICNHRKVITFPIHQSVSNIFLQNPKLIYLKDKNKLCIEVPSVAYIGDSHELLNYIATLGIKSVLSENSDHIIIFLILNNLYEEVPGLQTMKTEWFLANLLLMLMENIYKVGLLDLLYF